MRISIVVHDIGNNCVGRALVLGQLLEERHDVEMTGPEGSAELWSPARAELQGRTRRFRSGASAAELAEFFRDVDVLYAVKPKPLSLGTALRARRATGVPVIADVDDWETGLFLDNPKWLLRKSLQMSRDSFWGTLLLERRVRVADAVTVASSALRARFGGSVIRHVRDSRAFRPDHVSGAVVRRELGLPSEKIVMFMGSPRRHKGIGAVGRAVSSLADDDVRFVVVGAESAADAPHGAVVVGRQPLERVPEFLAAADVVVLAQQPSFASSAQVPAKLFDALAMGVPIVATDVSDQREIVGEAGLVVDPGDERQLVGALRSILYDAARAGRMSATGRKLFLDHYSVAAVAPRMEEVLDTVVG